MMKKDFLFEILTVLLCIAIILVFGVMMIRSYSGDAEAHEIMEQAQERIDLYYASQPAQERPTATVVVYESPAPSETPEPVEDWYIESIPLDKQLQKVAFDAACESGVDYFTALGLIQVESDFQLDAVSPCGSYGLCQLNPAWFPPGLSPEENVRAGMEYLGQLIEGHNGDVPAALTAYNAGYDTGDRVYANAVLRAAEEIMGTAWVVFP